jgi:tetratricopeptide (TPR) repeat protein
LNRAMAVLIVASCVLFTAVHGGAAAQETDPRVEFDSLFQSMLAKPADIEIILRFAALAVRLRDYESAIGAYERLLYFDPNYMPAKAELGALYFRLRSYRAARAYFADVVAAPNADDELKSRAEEYIAEIDKRLSPDLFRFYWHAGVRHQSNASAGPAQITGDPSLSSLFAQRPDWNAFGIANVTYVHDFQNQRGDTFEAALSTYYAQQFELKRFNVGAAEIQAGPRFGLFTEYMDGLSIRGYGIATGVLLGDRPYYSSLGGGVAVRYLSLEDSIIEGAFEYRDRNFYNSVNYPLAAEQTGTLLAYGLGSTGKFTDNLGWFVRGVIEQNRADTAYSAYQRWSVDVGLPITFPVRVAGKVHHWVFTPYAGYSETDYDAPNPSIDPLVTREDREWRVGASLDAVLIKNAGLRVQVHYNDNQSNLTNFTYKNLAVSFGPMGRF